MLFRSLNNQEKQERTTSLPLNLKQFQIEQEKDLLEQALLKTHHHQRKAADELGITYHQFRGLLKKHHILSTIKGIS